MVKIAIAQINPTVGDFTGNVDLIAAGACRAHAAHADLVVFPELAITGYYPGDLLESGDFLSSAQRALEEVKALSFDLSGLAIAVGCPRPNPGPGKPLFNSLVVLRNGAIDAEYAKILLPTYSIFDERRHFEPGPSTALVMRLGDQRVGFMICEDGWNDDGRDYVTNPFDLVRRAGADLVVSINASPSNKGKQAVRERIFSAAARRHDLPVVFVNQVGGQDQLVFDGDSFVLAADGAVAYRAAAFESDFAVLGVDSQRVDLLEGASRTGEAAVSDSEFYFNQIVLGIRDYARRCGFTKAVIGSSGGIDSALTLALAVEALGAANVTAITMPSIYSSAGSVDDSTTLCSNLGVKLLEHPIRELVTQYSAGFEDATSTPLQGLALENLQARIRGTILMEFSNTTGALLLTTGNKSEVSTGYSTLYGDTCGGLGPIGDLYKLEVFALSRYINTRAGREIIPNVIIDKEPSAELAPGQRDSDSLPPYGTLDSILKWHIEGERLDVDEARAAEKAVQALRQTAAGAATVQRVLALVARAEYKRRQSPPIIRVRCRAFGSGRQMPIAARYA